MHGNAWKSGSVVQYWVRACVETWCKQISNRRSVIFITDHMLSIWPVSQWYSDLMIQKSVMISWLNQLLYMFPLINIKCYLYYERNKSGNSREVCCWLFRWARYDVQLLLLKTEKYYTLDMSVHSVNFKFQEKIKFYFKENFGNPNERKWDTIFQSFDYFTVSALISRNEHCGVVVRALDLQSEGRGFESHSVRMSLDKAIHIQLSLSTQV